MKLSLKMLAILGVAMLPSIVSAATDRDLPDNNFVVDGKQYEGNDSVRLAGVPAGYTLVWSDEFDTPASLTEKWIPMDWEAQRVNHELQTYRPGDEKLLASGGKVCHTAEVSDGALRINCFKGEDGKIYSARMNSKTGDETASWKYGYFEARIRIPSGLGTWPAFWMMPADVDWASEGWPECGEIDIMEEVGADPNMAVCSLHAAGHNHMDRTQVSASRHIENMENNWIVYAMLWDEDHIEMYADGHQILNYANDGTGKRNWPYDRPYFVTLNLAWGGDWGGYRGVDESVLPVAMDVDYVRVYQKVPAVADL